MGFGLHLRDRQMKKVIAARSINGVGTSELASEEKIREMRSNIIIRRSSALVSIPEKIAGDKFAYKNWQIPDGVALFPLDWKMRFVDLYYPFAEDGPLLVDFPTFENQTNAIKEKQQILHALGHRHIYITNSIQMTEAEVREQLFKVKEVS